jgi:hypothetical protein
MVSRERSSDPTRGEPEGPGPEAKGLAPLMDKGRFVTTRKLKGQT